MRKHLIWLALACLTACAPDTSESADFEAESDAGIESQSAALTSDTNDHASIVIGSRPGSASSIVIGSRPGAGASGIVIGSRPASGASGIVIGSKPAAAPAKGVVIGTLSAPTTEAARSARPPSCPAGWTRCDDLSCARLASQCDYVPPVAW